MPQTNTSGPRWVLLETGSNQKYIFSTTKQRLQVAASAAIWSLGYVWVKEVAQSVADDHGCAFYNALAEIEDYFSGPTSGADAIVHVVEASGKAYLLVPTREVGEEIISGITLRAIKERTGIDVWGVVSDPLKADFSDAADRLREANINLEAQRYKRTPPVVTDPATPFHARCSYTNEVATTRAPETRKDSEGFLRSARVDYLFNSVTDARKRLEDKLIQDSGGSKDKFERALLQIKDLDQGLTASSWVGVIHADGNGVGKIFLNLAEVKANDPASSRPGVDFIVSEARLSRGVEAITWKAFGRTVDDVVGDMENCLLPVIVGGDDVVVMVSGKIAVRFAVELTRNFQRIASDEKDPDAREFKKVFADIDRVLGAPGGNVDENQNARNLSMAAGVLLTKIKHPFHHSVDVAEALTSLAKNRTRAQSSVAVHVLYEPSLRPLSQLREDASINGACYAAQPLVAEGEGIGTAAELFDMMEHLRAGEDGVSHGVMGLFREALTESSSVTEAANKVQIAKNRAKDLGMRSKLGIIESIAVDTSGDGNNLYAESSPTTFITAMELVDVNEAESAGADSEEEQ